jgi:uncharacterized protein YjaZ
MCTNRLINFAFFSVLFLAACKQPAAGVNPPAKPVGNGSSIVFLNDYYTHYLNDLKAGNKNIDSLYNADIKYPINRYFQSSEYSWLIASQFFYSPQKDTAGLSTRIDMLNAAEKTIEDTISAALARCNKYLKDDSITIYISPVEAPNETIKKMNGLAGFTAGSKKILMLIDPTVSTWKDWLAFAVTHEFNHAYWTKVNFSTTYTWTMLSYLVSEGRADNFAHFIYPSKLPAWDLALSSDQKAQLWSGLKSKLDTTDRYFQSSVMFGFNGYPQWAGYCLGYSIVQSALKNNPKLTPEQWTNMQPQEILKMSDYK